MDSELINWLLRDDNPAVAYRTRTELLGEAADNTTAKEWILSKLPENWYDTKGLWYTYYLSALAECGVKRGDIDDGHIKRAPDSLNTPLDCSCETFMLLRALVKLGYGNEPAVAKAITEAGRGELPDGGFLCSRRTGKLKYTPKSCYKANLNALLLAAECKKNGIECPFTERLTAYFLNRDIFYRTDNKQALVLEDRLGWRTVDTFFPPEVMRVGLQNVAESFAALGFGNDPRLNETYELLNENKDESGKVLLGDTLTKPYLPKERVGKPGKWVTFYTALAEKERNKV